MPDDPRDVPKSDRPPGPSGFFGRLFVGLGRFVLAVTAFVVACIVAFFVVCYARA